MNNLKEKFLAVYVNLPMGLRRDIIAVIDSEPMTWHVCYLEIKECTKLGDRILKYLNEMKFI